MMLRNEQTGEIPSVPNVKDYCIFCGRLTRDKDQSILSPCNECNNEIGGVKL